MRARFIKPGFFRDSAVASIDITSRLLFIGLWGLADYTGRLKCNLADIKLEVFPTDDVDIQQSLLSLKKSGLIDIYDHSEVGPIIHVINFEKHQHPHKNERLTRKGEPQPHLPVRQNGAVLANIRERSTSARADYCVLTTDYLNPPSQNRINTTEVTTGNRGHMRLVATKSDDPEGAA
jgi:hypothetical protein